MATSTDWDWISSWLADSMVIVHGHTFHRWWLFPSLCGRSTVLEVESSAWWEGGAVIVAIQITSLMALNLILLVPSLLIIILLVVYNIRINWLYYSLQGLKQFFSTLIDINCICCCSMIIVNPFAVDSITDAILVIEFFERLFLFDVLPLMVSRRTLWPSAASFRRLVWVEVVSGQIWVLRVFVHIWL